MFHCDVFLPQKGKWSEKYPQHPYAYKKPFGLSLHQKVKTEIKIAVIFSSLPGSKLLV